MKGSALIAAGLLLAYLALTSLFAGSTALDRADPRGGPLVASTPLQQSHNQMGVVPPPREMNGYSLKVQASLDMEALVLHRRNYRWGEEADLSPTDLALGWGPMSDPAFLEKVKISQRSRYYFWKTKARGMKGRVIVNSANMHIIPANEEVRKTLKDVREGDLVKLNGYLVNASKQNWRWTTSLSRSDTGGGACEVFLVEKLEIY